MRARLVVGLGLIAAAVSALHVLPMGGGDRVWRELTDVAHVIGFAVLAFAAVKLFRRNRARFGPLEPIVLAGAFAACVAVLSELAQIPTGRDANVSDLYRDAAGIAAGLLAASAAPAAVGRRIALTVLSAVVLVAGLFEPAAPLTARVAARLRFPVLMDFDHRLDAPLIRPMSARIELEPAPPEWPAPGKVARVEPRGNWRYEGISFFGLPPDWSGFEELRFLLAAEKPVRMSLTVRVHDRTHDNQYADRFNRAFDIGAEAVLIRIPLAEIRDAPSTRKLDLSRIADITVFATSPFESAFYVDDIRLE